MRAYVYYNFVDTFRWLQLPLSFKKYIVGYKIETKTALKMEPGTLTSNLHEKIFYH